MLLVLVYYAQRIRNISNNIVSLESWLNLDIKTRKIAHRTDLVLKVRELLWLWL